MSEYQMLPTTPKTEMREMKQEEPGADRETGKYQPRPSALPHAITSRRPELRGSACFSEALDTGDLCGAKRITRTEDHQISNVEEEAP